MQDTGTPTERRIWLLPQLHGKEVNATAKALWRKGDVKRHAAKRSQMFGSCLKQMKYVMAFVGAPGNCEH